LRFARDFVKNEAKKKRKRGEVDPDYVSLPREAMSKLLIAFRNLQRCHSEDQWDADINTFREKLREICEDEGVAGAFDAVFRYFEENWFIELWRGK
jgi:phage-related protein